MSREPVECIGLSPVTNDASVDPIDVRAFREFSRLNDDTELTIVMVSLYVEDASTFCGHA